MDVKMERGFHGFNTDGHGCEKGDADTRRFDGVTLRGCLNQDLLYSRISHGWYLSTLWHKVAKTD